MASLFVAELGVRRVHWRVVESLSVVWVLVAALRLWADGGGLRVVNDPVGASRRLSVRIELPEHLAGAALSLLVDWLDLLAMSGHLPASESVLVLGRGASLPVARVSELFRDSKHESRVIFADEVGVAGTHVAEPVVLLL